MSSNLALEVRTLQKELKKRDERIKELEDQLRTMTVAFLNGEVGEKHTLIALPSGWGADISFNGQKFYLGQGDKLHVEGFFVTSIKKK